MITIFGPIAVADFVLNSPNSDKLFSTGPILLWTLGSYVTGFLLGQLWEMTLARLTGPRDRKVEIKCQQECLSEHKRMQKALKRPEVGITPDNLPRVFVMRDHIRHIAPEEASRLLKVRAERRSCQVLLMGFFTLSIANGVYLVTRLEVARIVLEVLLIVAIAACWGGAQRLRRLLANGTTVSWLVHVAADKTSTHGQNPAARQTRPPSRRGSRR
jgi:hypothetical protein